MDISSVLQRTSVNYSFGSKNSRRFSSTFMRGEDHLYWFAQVLHLFHLQLDGETYSEDDLAFVQYSKATPLIDKIDK